jgi:hypothetical protein
LEQEVETLQTQLSVTAADVQKYHKPKQNTSIDRDQIITDFLDGAGI